MTQRGRHLEEFTYALAHNLPLPDARKALAAEKRRLAEAALDHLNNRPVVPTRELHKAQAERDRAFQRWDAPWMGRD